jgi:mRNA-degrading endonuclease toxin of MazEF toxin-antitoxin module
VQRGDLYVYVPVIPRPGISIMRLIVSSDAINDADIPWVIGVHLIDDHDPMSLLAPRIGDHGWAIVTTIERVMRNRLGERVGVATPEEMEQIDIALRASLSL